MANNPISDEKHGTGDPSLRITPQELKRTESGSINLGPSFSVVEAIGNEIASSMIRTEPVVSVAPTPPPTPRPPKRMGMIDFKQVGENLTKVGSLMTRVSSLQMHAVDQFDKCIEQMLALRDSIVPNVCAYNSFMIDVTKISDHIENVKKSLTEPVVLWK